MAWTDFWDFIDRGAETAEKVADARDRWESDNSTTAEATAQGTVASAISNIPITVITGLTVTVLGGVIVYFLTRR